MKDVEDLHAINVKIGEAENANDRAWFQGVLAERFVLRRASGVLDDRVAFLQKLEKDDRDDRTTTIEDIDLLRGSRAVVHAIVTTGGKRYDNLRIFVRGGAHGWSLLAWANEELA
jgi:hypothetical protein